MALTFEQARACVLREVGAARSVPATEQVPALEAAGRVLAEEITADRDYPPFPRSARDGFAVRAADVPGELHVIGEVRAGEVFRGSVSAGGVVSDLFPGGGPFAGPALSVYADLSTEFAKALFVLASHNSDEVQVDGGATDFHYLFALPTGKIMQL